MDPLAERRNPVARRFCDSPDSVWKMFRLADCAPTSILCNMMCGGLHIMATNLSIDPALIERALEVSGERTKRAAVTKALEEFIARRRQKKLLNLLGKLEWDSSYDYKSERSRE